MNDIGRGVELESWSRHDQEKLSRFNIRQANSSSSPLSVGRTDCHACVRDQPRG